MTKVTYTLTEQFSDSRSNEIAYKFLIENQGASAIELLSIIPRIPEGVTLVEVKDPSLAASRRKHVEICGELTNIVNDQVLMYSSDVRSRYRETLKELLESIANNYLSTPFSLSTVSNYLKLVAWMIKSQAPSFLKRVEQSYQALGYTISNSTHANLAYEHFINIDEVDTIIKKLFRAKIEQIEEIEKSIGKDPTLTSIATIEPDSFFAITYVLRFPRKSFFESTKFNVDVEVSYSEKGKAERQVGGTTTSVVISPNSLLLTCIAILFSIVGVILKVAIENSIQNNNFSLYEQIYFSLIGSPTISAIILAIVFFNVYEYTELGKRFKMGLSWRSALLIGVLCGLLGDRVLAAIKGFIGG